MSEYVRALKLKTDNHKDDACNLFRELLETEVLNINHEKKDKLFSVKYNCYKNLGFIYIELGDSDMALDYLLNVRSPKCYKKLLNFFKNTLNSHRHTTWTIRMCLR